MQCFTKVRSLNGSKAKTDFLYKLLAAFLFLFFLEIAGFLNVCGNRLGSWALRLKHEAVQLMFTPRIITIHLKFDHYFSMRQKNDR